MLNGVSYAVEAARSTVTERFLGLLRNYSYSKPPSYDLRADSSFLVFIGVRPVWVETIPCYPSGVPLNRVIHKPLFFNRACRR